MDLGYVILQMKAIWFKKNLQLIPWSQEIRKTNYCKTEVGAGGYFNYIMKKQLGTEVLQIGLNSCAVWKDPNLTEITKKEKKTVLLGPKKDVKKFV